MKKMNMIVALIAAMLLTMAVTAQAPPPIFPLLTVTRVMVKSDRVAEWSDVEKLFSEAYKKGGGQWRRIYRSRTGNTNEFLVLTPFSSFADLDGESFTAKGASEQDRARWGARRAQCTDRAVTTYERLVPDALINTPGASLPALLQETRFRVKQGMGTQFTDFVKTETIPALKKAGVGLYVLRNTAFGGSRNLYIARRGFGKYAELDVNTMQVVLGSEGATKYYAKSSALLNDVEVGIYVYQPNISYSGQ